MLVQNYFRGGVETKCIMAKVKVANAHILEACLSNQQSVIYLFIYLLFSHNKDYTSITLYKDVARGPQKTTRLVRGGPLVTIILSNRTITVKRGKE